MFFHDKHTHWGLFYAFHYEITMQQGSPIKWEKQKLLVHYVVKYIKGAPPPSPQLIIECSTCTCASATPRQTRTCERPWHDVGRETGKETGRFRGGATHWVNLVT